MNMLKPSSPELPLQSPPSEGDIDIRHPIPDLQSTQGAYVGNIERLEDKAERMSTSGSELGEEIRKLQLEQKLSDSRRSSLLSGPLERRSTTRSRGASTSSHSHSIVDVNTTARWGGYSPGAHVTSPLGSVTSGSWSGNRQRSASGASRLAQISSAAEGNKPLSPRYSALPKASPVGSPVLHLESPAMHQGGFYEPEQPKKLSLHQPDEARYGPVRTESPVRPTSAGSGDTFQQATRLFRDFDGTHYDHDFDHSHEGESLVEEAASSHRSTVRLSSLPRSVDFPPVHTAPLPSNDMVYYPAPVPQMLNLPKRLSQLPSASVQAKRRTQMMNVYSAEARKSALWMSGEQKSPTGPSFPSPPRDKAARRSTDFRKSLAALPPQLRASMYFDHPGTSQEVEIKGSSAQDTLDSILEASASAPVSAFTDHPFAGHVGDEVYGKEAARQSTMSIPESPKPNAKRRSSIGMLLRGKSDDGLAKVHKRNSSHLSMMVDEDLNEASANPVRHSQISAEPPRLGTIEGVDEDTTLRRSSQDSHDYEAQQDDVDGPKPDELEQDVLNHDEYFRQPTTLLAELQIRKQQQKTRNRTAATAFPNGMHATLLEMDAVAQIEKKKRQTGRVNLAWEDPMARTAADDEEQDDVPLGVLFPGRDGLVNKKHGQRDSHRPVGLLERREMEDNEPLSRRRNRLKGIEDRPAPPRQSIPLAAVQSAEQVTATLPPPPKPEEPEETLGQRLRRLKDKKALDSAIGDVATRPVSELFASEMMSSLGVDEKAPGIESGAAGGPSAAVGDIIGPSGDVEETLGQRRRRLQAEALVNGIMQEPAAAGGYLGVPGAAATRPPLRASHSMADILALHPTSDRARKVSNELLIESLPQGSLLAQSEMTRSRHKQQMLNHNNRASSFGLQKPLVDVGRTSKDKDWDTPLGLLGNANPRSRQSAYPPMGMNPTLNQTSPNFFQQNFNQMGLHNQATSPMGFPQTGMGMPMSPMQMQMQLQMMQMQQQQMQMGMAMNPMGVNLNMNMGMMNTQSNIGGGAMMEEPPMDPRQKAMIDRWRQSVMP